jgi:hypothetical protein
MKWTLIYLQQAQDQLATIWLKSSDQGDVTRAADLLEKQLRDDPYSSSSIARHDNSRIMVEAPLAAGYDVSDDDRRVTVWAFWLLK